MVALARVAILVERCRLMQPTVEIRFAWIWRVAIGAVTKWALANTALHSGREASRRGEPVVAHVLDYELALNAAGFVAAMDARIVRWLLTNPDEADIASI